MMTNMMPTTPTFQTFCDGHISAPICEPTNTSPIFMPSSSTSPYRANELRCRVCERNYDGSQHFGIDICRACAAFFRRSVTVKKSFVCRRGNENCHLNTPRKITCQKCRWMRCLQVGLQIELVHGRRSPDTSKSNGAHPHKTDLEDDYDSADGSDSKSIGEPEEIVQIFKPKPLQMAIDVDNAHTNFIQRVLINYREFSKQRLEVENEIDKTGDQEVVINGKTMYKTTRQRLSIIYQKQLPLLHNFLNSTFDVYANSSADEQRRICILFYPVLWEIEACYWTYRFFPNDDTGDRLMTTQTTFIDLNDLPFWLGNGFNQNDMQNLDSIFRALILKIRGLIIRPMHSLIISEVEFAVLLALNIWATRNHRNNDESERKASEMRTKIFDDIHILYRHEMKMDNYAKRMGDLMCLFTDVQTAGISSTIEPILFSEMHQTVLSA